MLQTGDLAALPRDFDLSSPIDIQGQTLLHLATVCEMPDLACRLLLAGASPLVKDRCVVCAVCVCVCVCVY